MDKQETLDVLERQLLEYREHGYEEVYSRVVSCYTYSTYRPTGGQIMAFAIEPKQTVLFIGDSITDCERTAASPPLGAGYVELPIYQPGRWLVVAEVLK